MSLVEIAILTFAVTLFSLILYVGWRMEKADNEIKNIRIDLDWVEMEEELNKRVDVIGQNGNEGTHYNLCGETN